MRKLLLTVFLFCLATQITIAKQTVRLPKSEFMSSTENVEFNVVSSNKRDTESTNEAQFIELPKCTLKRIIETRLTELTPSGEASVFAVLTPEDKYEFFSRGPVNRNSVLRAGSITKIFTGFLALENGLDLSKKPVEYGYNPTEYDGSDAMTFRNIGAHMSGIPEYATLTNLLNDDQTDWRFGGNFNVSINVDLGWKNKSLDFQPTAEYCYSNTNCEVIGNMLPVLVNKSVNQLIAERFSGLSIDDGTTHRLRWPRTDVYQNWPYPASLPGVSGSLIGNAKDLLTSYKTITQSPFFDVMQQWQYDKNSPSSVSECPLGRQGHAIAGGDRYGFLLQHFGSDQIYSGLTGEMTSVLADDGSVGHDGDLIVRTLMIIHPTGNIFLYHYTNSIPNTELNRRMSTLITDYLLHYRLFDLLKRS